MPSRRPSPRPALLARLEQLHRLAETVMSPGGLRALRTWRPFSLAAFRLVQGLHAEGPPFACVVDVGANAGQFARASLGRWPHALVVAFEPQPEQAERLRATVGAAGRLEVHAVALADTDGTTTFFPHRHHLSSSALPVAEEARSQAWAEELPAVTVPLARLDTVLAGRALARPCLLKVDVQGLELQVLRGAVRTLEQVDAVVVEAAFHPGYAGQPPFSTVHDALVDLGWSLVRPLDVFREADGRIVEADLLYRRQDAT